MRTRAIPVICLTLLTLALPGRAPAGPAAAGRVLVAQNDTGLEDRPAAGRSPSASPAPGGASGEAAKAKPKPAEQKSPLKEALVSMVKSLAFWGLLGAALVFGYCVAWLAAHGLYQRNHPTSAMGSARTGVVMGLFFAPLLPFAYVWRTGQPWLWAIVLAIPFVISALVVAVGRSDAA